MTIEELIRQAEERWAARKKLLLEKGASYSGPEQEDTLANFKRQALIKRTSPEDILITYLLKHIDAIVTWANTRQESEPIEERIDDAQNYLELLRGLVRESSPNKTAPSHWAYYPVEKEPSEKSKRWSIEDLPIVE